MNEGFAARRHGCAIHARQIPLISASPIAHDPEAEAERERLAAIQRAINGDNPYQDLLDQDINPAFFGVTAPTT